MTNIIGSGTVWVNINKRFIIDKVYGATLASDEYFKLPLKKTIAMWNEINVYSPVGMCYNNNDNV